MRIAAVQGWPLPTSSANSARASWISSSSLKSLGPSTSRFSDDLANFIGIHPAVVLLKKRLTGRLQFGARLHEALRHFRKLHPRHHSSPRTRSGVPLPSTVAQTEAGCWKIGNAHV